MTLRDADIDHLADLARLDVAADDRAALRNDIERLLAYVAMLQEVDVDGVAPLLRPTLAGDGLRPDGREDGSAPLRTHALTSLSAERQGGRIVVPRTVDQDG